MKLYGGIKESMRYANLLRKLCEISGSSFMKCELSAESFVIKICNAILAVQIPSMAADFYGPENIYLAQSESQCGKIKVTIVSPFSC